MPSQHLALPTSHNRGKCREPRGDLWLVTELSSAARRVRLGDPSAFRIIVEATMPSLVRLAARITGTRAEAEDVVQEAYIRAYRAILAGRFDERSRVATWIHRIVVNAAIDHVRSRKPRASTNADLAVDPVDGSRAESIVALRELDDWLSGLPPEQRVAIVLKSVEGWTSAEIAAALGCSEGAVEQKLVRARNALRVHNQEGWQ